MDNIDCTLLGGGDNLTFSKGFIISECYKPGIVVGKVRESLMVDIVYQLIVIMNKSYEEGIGLETDPEEGLFFNDLSNIIHRQIEWLH